MNIEKAIVGLVCFTLGAVVGAVVALLFAPMSGRELQYRIRKESELQAQKARTEWVQGVSNLNKQVDGLRSQMTQIGARG